MKKNQNKSENHLQTVACINWLLSGYPMEKETKVSLEKEHTKNGLTVEMLCVHTDAAIKVTDYLQGIACVQSPIVYTNVQDFEQAVYEENSAIYEHIPEKHGEPLIINDMQILSRHIVIRERLVVSQNYARKNCPPSDCGFAFFHEYVLKKYTMIGDWTMCYYKGDFIIGYDDIPVYTVKKIRLQDTYPYVISLIRRIVPMQRKQLPEHFAINEYRRPE